MKIISNYQHSSLFDQIDKNLRESCLDNNKQAEEIERISLLQEKRLLLDEVFDIYAKKIQEIRTLVAIYQTLDKQTRVLLRKQQRSLNKKKRETGVVLLRDNGLLTSQNTSILLKHLKESSLETNMPCFSIESSNAIKGMLTY
ncbi:MAG: hypothetical protein J0I84_06190 [Terrimonas sp.]|uniref:hypothetical protein n=1 Tax=uncultured Dysgonomonas sp. TaxID=206096 RepID=UPI001ACF4386|nr:hypothetical protein [uncultured Dysgonomonas sp.]MBN8786661.1 hypothetical protein [Terrimonas sp.]MBN8857094.1 hypothetical protein [Sphingobacteriales bacterium]